MVELFDVYFKMNERNASFVKKEINIHLYCQTVKLSVLGVEFRDKLLQRNMVPKLLGHSNQAAPGTRLGNRMSAGACQDEIIDYLEALNAERKETFKLLNLEFTNQLMMEKRCKELTRINRTRERNVLGDRSDAPEIESQNSDSDSASSSDLSISDILSQGSKIGSQGGNSPTKPPNFSTFKSLNVSKNNEEGSLGSVLKNLKEIVNRRK